MATYQELEQVQAYARLDGALVAAMWTASFACMVGFFHAPSAVLSLGWMAIGAYSVVFATKRLRRFRDDVLDGYISFARAFSHSILTYLHASLLFALAQFVYFQFLDKGFIVNQYVQNASSEESRKALEMMGLRAEDLNVVLENISSLRPIDIALQFFTTNVMMGLFISVPVALLMVRKPKKKQ